MSATCPSCEYERGTSGKPVAENGQMRCLSCGNVWKEYNDVRLLEIKKEALLRPEQVPPAHSLSSPGFVPLAVNSGKKGIASVLIVSTLFVAGIGLSLLFFALNPFVGEKKGLDLSGLTFEELARGGRGKVIRVRGVIENAGVSTARVPRLAIILRKSNGRELTRWYYQSPIGVLKPGSKTRFVSSIQYNNPVIASVDAVFE
ncbi:MAG: hypothetical protein AAGA53_13885 [Pseudomonadota bacterium]